MHKKTSRKLTSADEKLAPEQFDELNRQFYQGFHQEFISGRLEFLCLLHEQPELVEKLLEDGPSWGLLKGKVVPDEKSIQTMKRNAELELVALRQHAAEVLFRIFWVHAQKEPCPWLALARIRNPGDLKKLANNYLTGLLWPSQEVRAKYHARAVWGAAALNRSGDIQDILKFSAPVVADWIAVAADLILDAPLYNAYKHGLAIVPSQPFSISYGGTGPEEPRLVMDASAGFSYINHKLDNVHQRYRWSLVTESVDYQAAAGEIAVFGELLGIILDTGAQDRGVKERQQEVKIHNAEITPEKIRNPEAMSGFSLQRYEPELLYYK